MPAGLKDVGVPKTAIFFDRQTPFLDHEHPGLQERLASSVGRRSIQGKLLGDPVPGEGSPCTIPAVCIANPPQQNAPLRASEPYAPECFEQLCRKTNKPERWW